jgi:putative two-component system response regulator
MTRPRRILAVDDDESSLILMENLIHSFGYEAEIARSATEAMTKLEHDIDLIVLDIMMPGIDGFAAARQIRHDRRFSDIPIIVVSVLSSSEDRLRAAMAGADAFFVKPFDKFELRVRLETLLTKKRPRNQLEI